MGFVDLHSHDLDDGASGEATAIALLDGLAALGVAEQGVPPHQKSGRYVPIRDDIEAALAAVEHVREPGPPMLRLGAEIMWDDVFLQRLAEGEIPYHRDTVAFLVEVPPPLLPPGMIDRLFRLRLQGRVPVLAHPERYQPLWADEKKLGHAAVVRRFDHAPRAILAGELPG